MRRLLASLVLAGTLIVTLAGDGEARSEKTLAYTRETVWPTAVRFLVVDERVKVTDKDPDAGYVLFELKDEGKTFRGSLEVMTVVKDKRTSVKFVLQIQDRPDWMEIAMLNRLERKLRSELGSPSPVASPLPAPTPAPSEEPKPAEPPAPTK